MDYEKKIKNALNDKSVPFEVQAWLEEQFPELKESKDNRIMNIIRGWIYTRPASFFDNGISKEEILAWLEKQGEQKPANSYCQKNCRGFQETGKCFADGDCKAKREAESNDKNEPNFHEGAWVVFDNGNVEHITSVGTHGYTFDDGDYLLHDECDKIAHLWSIQDAKDGDVLVSRSPFIYGKQCPYGGLNWCNNKFIKASNFIFTDNPVHPATKEQRDFLFQKMKEAGYTFDFEKKELKKVEQEQDSINPSEYINDIGGNGCYLKNTAQVSSWSKKDEKMFEYALHMIEWYSGKNEDKSRFVSDWLKSLKQRIGG